MRGRAHRAHRARVCAPSSRTFIFATSRMLGFRAAPPRTTGGRQPARRELMMWTSTCGTAAEFGSATAAILEHGERAVRGLRDTQS
jgi:hypothetical protein